MFYNILFKKDENHSKSYVLDKFIYKIRLSEQSNKLYILPNIRYHNVCEIINIHNSEHMLAYMEYQIKSNPLQISPKGSPR